MKYILQEQKYILNEDLSEKEVKKLLGQLQKNKALLNAEVEKFSKYVNVLNDSIKKLDELEKSLVNQPETNDSTTKIIQFKKELSDSLNEIDSNWKSKYTNIAAILNNNDNTTGISELKEQLNDCFTFGSHSAKDIITALKNTLRSYNLSAEQLAKLEDVSKPQSLINKINELINDLDKPDLAESNNQDIIDECKEIDNLLVELGATVDKPANNDKQANNDKSANTAAQYTYDNVKNNSVDLDNEYKNLKTKDEVDNFWKKYFKEFWGNKSEKIKSLGNTFVQEVTKISFDPELNYFIDYLRKVIDVIQPKSYDAIHNAIISNDLEDKDLLGQGRFREKNIIFNADFLSKSLEDCTELLKLQKKLKDSSIAKDPNEINVFYTQDNKIAPVTVIKKEIAKLINSDKEDASDEFINSILKNKANEDAIFVAAIDMLMPNLDVYKKVVEKNPEISTRYAAAVTKLGSNLAKSKSDAYNNILKTNSKKFSTEQLVKIINAIAKNKQAETK